MSIYDPISEALGILPSDKPIVYSDSEYVPFVPGAFVGQKHTEETKRLISEIHKGIPKGPQSEEHRKNIGKSKRGIRLNLNDDQKRKRSEKFLGDKNPFFGKSHSLETRLRISEGNKKNVMTCPICDKTMNKANYIKYKHGLECKKGI